jgi:S-formylglutathione hydrolase FrmB
VNNPSKSDRDSSDPAPAISVRADPDNPRIHRVTFLSAAIGRETETVVVTPGDHRRQEREQLPVLFLLHGGDDVPRSWVDRTDLLALSESARIVVVAPEAGKVGYYTHWRRADAEGTVPDWPRLHLDEVPAYVLPRFTTSTRWAVAGLSMGGYGAMAYAAKRPGTFAAAASISGLPHTTKRGIPAFLGFVLHRQGENRYALWGSPKAEPAIWLANNPWHLAESLRGTALYLSSGDGRKESGDTVFTGSGVVERLIAASTWGFAARLDELGIDYIASRHRGTHDWPTWRREFRRCWPFLLTQLQR